MATLNPGRTRREYEKAVGYFFLTPGVPAELQALTFDLLLAYRGALALRAAPLERGGAYAVSTGERGGPALGAPVRSALPGPDEAAEHAQGEDDGSDSVVRPLAPATVNIRLTALRQFLVHCAMMELLAGLTPDRIRLALRRLQIDRRRPYQILAESEWEGFLAAAALPSSPRQVVSAGVDHPDSGRSPDEGQMRARRGPWGTPRAARVQAALGDRTRDEEEAATKGHADERRGSPLVVRSRAGLTGERTAQRDHALIALALATGLRAIEISLLDLGDLTRELHDGQEEWWLVLPDAKTKGQHGGRTLPLAKPLVDTLLAYVRSTGRKWENAADRATPLFLRGRTKVTDASGVATQPHAGDRQRLHLAQIRAIIDRAETQWLALRSQGDDARGMLAGDTRSISPHALRHSTAIALLQGNAAAGRPPASVEHVRGWLGHFDIRTTQGYLSHLESREHRRPYALTVSPAPNSPPVSQSGQAEPMGADERQSRTKPPNDTASPETGE
jgi:integrase